MKVGELDRRTFLVVYHNIFLQRTLFKRSCFPRLRKIDSGAARTSTSTCIVNIMAYFVQSSFKQRKNLATMVEAKKRKRKLNENIVGQPSLTNSALRRAAPSRAAPPYLFSFKLSRRDQKSCFTSRDFVQDCKKVERLPCSSQGLNENITFSLPSSTAQKLIYILPFKPKMTRSLI